MQEYPDNRNAPVITVIQHTWAYGYTEDGKDSSGAVSCLSSKRAAEQMGGLTEDMSKSIQEREI